MKSLFSCPSRSSSSSQEDDSLTGSDPSAPPCISQLFTDAALYGNLLVREGCCSSRRDVDGFADLVGRDLNPSEQSTIAVDRLAKLTVTSNHWTTEELTEEPESYTSDETLFDTDSQASSSSQSSTDTNVWTPAPKELVQLFVEEFGALAAEGEEEELIFEADVGLFLGVVIVGVVHLTTHRLTFHASLLATQPDQVIKAGPAIIHRKPFFMKRRIWLELSHDMICSYNSGSEEDRIRPFRTILLSSVKKIYPLDLKHPKYIHMAFESKPKDFECVVEFTTEEAASEWRRELEGALFLFRHRRSQVLDKNAEASTGVRLSVPLHRIQDVQVWNAPASSMTFLSLQVQLSPTDTNGFNIQDGENRETQTLRMAQIVPSVQWSELGNYVTAAKARRESIGSEADASPLIVDFGPLTFSENDTKIPDSDAEHAVSVALGLGSESNIWIVKSRVRRGFASCGDFVVTPNIVGFWGKSFTQSVIRYRIPMSVVKLVSPVNSRLCSHSGIVLEMEGHSNLRFEFKTAKLRDEAIRRINAFLQSDKASSSLSEPVSTVSSSFSFGSDGLKQLLSPTELISPISRTVTATSNHSPPAAFRLKLPKVINLPRDHLPKKSSLHFVCLTIGSRGDVQPYIALGLGLQNEGHRVTIVTHPEYKEWIVGFGLEHRQAGGDPGALMKLSVEHKMFSPDFFRESFGNFRSWLDQLLEEAWTGCQGADVLLESPSAMAGVHIAEALKIPYFRTFTMPWTRTSQFPHPFLSPPVEAPTFNSLSYVLFDNVLWTATSGQINKWRKNVLKVDSTDMGHLAQSRITSIYNFSQAVVPKPLDWGDSIVVSGYWFLDNPDLQWTPPPSLIEWMTKARKDEKPIVYIGFGSITVPHPNQLTGRIIKAVLKSDVRAIISKGWSARMSKDDEPEVEIPPECYQLDKVPHDWLFPQIDAALHHGGAGTTGASLRAGIPTLIKPWFGDQYFWAARVQKLGAGLRVPGLRVRDLSRALTRATTSRVMKEKAAGIGERIRSENGVQAAIRTIYTYLPRASKDRKTLD